MSPPSLGKNPVHATRYYESDIHEKPNLSRLRTMIILKKIPIHSQILTKCPNARRTKTIKISRRKYNFTDYFYPGIFRDKTIDDYLIHIPKIKPRI